MHLRTLSVPAICVIVLWGGVLLWCVCVCVWGGGVLPSHRHHSYMHGARSHAVMQSVSAGGSVVLWGGLPDPPCITTATATITIHMHAAMLSALQSVSM